MWGVQFHPESIATEHGRAIAENFYAMASRHRPPRPSCRRRRAAVAEAEEPADGPKRRPGLDFGPSAGGVMRLRVRTFDGRGADRGALRTALRRRRARLLARQRRRADAAGAVLLHGHQRRAPSAACSSTTSRPARSTVERGGVEHRRAQVDLRPARPRSGASIAVEPPAGSARGLVGGYVGYLGYELQGRLRLAQRAPLRPAGRGDDARQPRRRRRPRPPPHPPARARPRGRRRGRALARGGRGGRRRGDRRARRRRAPTARRPPDPAPHVSFQCGRGREQYLADIARSQAELAAGESYEVCLTDQFSTDASPDPFALYRQLRRSNPAPFAAYLQVRRARDRQLLAGALPLGRPRAPRRRRARSRGRSPAARTRSRTPPAAPSWPRTKRPRPST